MGEILGWEEILDVWTNDFGATAASSKIPAVRKKKVLDRKKIPSTVVVRSRIKDR